MKFKNLPILLVAVLMLGFVFSSCEKQETTNKKSNLVSNKSKENKIFSELYLDSLTLKKEIYSSLEFFQNFSCETDNMETMMSHYFKFKGIEEEINCDFKETEIYVNNVIKSKPEETLDYLYKENYLSEEACDFLSNYVDEIVNSKDGEELTILDNYLSKIKYEKNISKEEKDKIMFALQFSKYSFNYFEENSSKGNCVKCMRTYKNNILIITPLLSLGPIIACTFLANPIAIAACITGVAAVGTYMEICYYCHLECWFCISK